LLAGKRASSEQQQQWQQRQRQQLHWKRHPHQRRKPMSVEAFFNSSKALTALNVGNAPQPEQSQETVHLLTHVTEKATPFLMPSSAATLRHLKEETRGSEKL